MNYNLFFLFLTIVSLFPIFVQILVMIGDYSVIFVYQTLSSLLILNDLRLCLNHICFNNRFDCKIPGG